MQPPMRLRSSSDNDTIQAMLKIRLSQSGTTNRKTYKIIAIEEGKRREGKPVEFLGTYNPLVKPPILIVKRDRIAYWKSVGAAISPGALKILEEKK